MNEKVGNYTRILNSDNAPKFMRDNISKDDVGRCIDFCSTAAGHGYIFSNVQDYVRDAQVFNVLNEKFINKGMFSSPEKAKEYYSLIKDLHGENSPQMIRLNNMLQGDGAGEVDAMRSINGSLKGLLYKADFAKDGERILSNTPGIDLEIKSRITGEIVDRVQVKSPYTGGNITKTVDDLVKNKHFTDNDIIAGPKELIDKVKARGLPNKTIEVGTIADNKTSLEDLKNKISSGEASAAVFTNQVFAQMAQGAVIGAAVQVTLSGVANYIAYRKGEITGKEAFKKTGKDGARGAVTGGAIAGLYLVFPPGAIGLGIGIVVGMQVRRVVDIAFGKGAYLDSLNSIGAMTSATKEVAKGVFVMEHALNMQRQSIITTEHLLGEYIEERDIHQNDFDRLKSSSLFK